MQGPNANQAGQALQVPVGQFQGIMRSKKHVYEICAQEVQMYLPSFDTCGLDFLKMLLSGERKL